MLIHLVNRLNTNLLKKKASNRPILRVLGRVSSFVGKPVYFNIDKICFIYRKIGVRELPHLVLLTDGKVMTSKCESASLLKITYTVS